MKFVMITQDTRTEHGDYYRGERRKVSEEHAADLIGKGWAKDAPESVTLDVHNSKQGVSATKVM